MALPPQPPSGSSSGRRRGLGLGAQLALVAAALVVGLLVVTGIVVAVVVGHRGSGSDTPTTQAPPTPSATQPLPSAPADLSRFYDQRLAWHGCGGNQCATLSVPLDYADPTGRAIRIAVLKAPASDPAHRIGALVVNPGGPGGSGVEYAAGGSQQFGGQLTRYYDVVGFDPRGVGHSTPLQCGDTAEKDQLLAYDPDPDTAAERATIDRLFHRFGEGCLARDAGMARHMSTVEAAKDMDVLRAALKQPKLDYYGASYGTLLGATYANLFPKNVGRMVLDGAIDPALSNEQLSLGQAHGFETALRAYVQHCVDGGSCFLGSSVDAGTKRIRALLDQIEAKPLPTASGRQLSIGNALYGVWFPLYVKQYWPTLDEALRQAMSGSGTALLRLADVYNSRGADGYTDNSLDALIAVNCLDHDDSIPTSQVPSKYAEFLAASPTFGRTFAYSLSTCSVWPVKSGQHTVALHAPGAPPIVVVGTTRDPATPYAWARSLASELDSGVFVSRDGDGHTGFQQGNSCVDTTIEKYLLRDVVPEDGLRC